MNDDEESHPRRELMDDETELLRKFDENDKEIDGLLDGVINQLDRLKYTAEQLNQGVEDKNKLTEQLNQKIQISHRRLVKKDGQLKRVLQDYKS